jgi:hypothetical protein
MSNNIEIQIETDNPLNESIKQIESNKENKLIYNKISKLIDKKLNDQDFVQSYYVSLNIILELYRVFTSSLLIIFVPQLCSNQTCSIQERLVWSEIDELYNVTLIFNFISLIIFFCTYIIEIKREIRLIKYLDVNANMPNDDKDVEQALKILPIEKINKILNLDKYYRYSFYISVVIYLINIILSALVINEYYLNSQSITTFITYVLFMCTKLSNIYIVTNTEKNIFYSAYLKSNVQFNDVDHSYKNIF